MASALIIKEQFTLSFTGDGYLFTESLFSEHTDRWIISITCTPFDTEGLVMFAYDEQVCHYQLTPSNTIGPCDRRH